MMKRRTAQASASGTKAKPLAVACGAAGGVQAGDLDAVYRRGTEAGSLAPQHDFHQSTGGHADGGVGQSLLKAYAAFVGQRMAARHDRAEVVGAVR